MLRIAGVDEVGRGPLAGPVVAAAVILSEEAAIDGLADSKQLSEGRRERLYETILERADSYALGRVEPEEIDSLNIHHASLLAMRRAVEGLSIDPHEVQVDGRFCPDVPFPVEAIVKGDQSVPVISAASIVAKVVRDREMVEFDREFPGYGFAQHKGYPTRAHYEAILALGITPIHRRSFKLKR